MPAPRVRAASLRGLLLLVTLVAAVPGTDAPFEETVSIPVTVWNRTLATIRQPIEGLTPEERVQRIQQRLTALPDEALGDPVTVRPFRSGATEGRIVAVGEAPIMALLAGDVHHGVDLDAAAELVASRLRELLQARRDQHRPEVILAGLWWSAVATVALLLALWLVGRALRAVSSRADRLPVRLPHLAGLDPAPMVRGLLRLVLRACGWALLGAIVYVWLAVVLAQFPYTRPLAGMLSKQVVALGAFVVSGILRALPGLGMVALIVLLTRLATRGIDAFFAGLASGTIQIPWLQPETAQATRRVAGILLWLFALTVAYPYIPGSSSDAFKGVSVFAGLLLTLGSAGMVNQMMSGLVVVYARMMKPGDMVQVGDVTGQVTALGFLSTKVRTPTGHEVTIPNAVLTGTGVANYSRFDAATGPVIAATVTIGYDTPWRQVHGLLELAASRCAGIDRTAAPAVLQTALGDFAVEYQLRCRILRVEDRQQVLSDLHARILDAFNEFGVQIMSPHFEGQPAQPVVVPAGREAPPPARVAAAGAAG